MLGNEIESAVGEVPVGIEQPGEQIKPVV